MLRVAMGLHYAGERMAEWALKEGGIAGAIGVVLGAVIGWPREVHETIGNLSSLTITSYENFWRHGSFEEVVTLGIVGAGLMGVVFAALALAIFRKRKPQTNA
jgi:hypothetical protein